jgi:adenylylsulfate kinase
LRSGGKRKLNRVKEGFVLWMTGLPCSGKTTIARRLCEMVDPESIEIMDGDELRKGLSAGTGFSREDREMHNKRVAYLSNLLAKHRVGVIVALVSPYRTNRDSARSLVSKNFFEVWVNCSVDECIKRDVKGMYKKALKGEIKNFTGIDDPYEPPANPEITVNTSSNTIDQCANQILEFLENRQLVGNQKI